MNCRQWEFKKSLNISLIGEKTPVNSVFTREQFWNCNDELILWYLNYRVYTRQIGTTTSPSLRLNIPEQGEEAMLVFLFFWHADCYFIWDRNSIRNCAVYLRKWIEGHVALPPKSQFRSQSIHMAISLRNLRDVSLQKHLQTNIWIAQFILAFCDANLRTHGPKYHHYNDGNSNDHSNCAFCSRVKTL